MTGLKLIQQFIIDTMYLTDEESGVFTRLMTHQLGNGFIPADIERLRRIAPSIDRNEHILRQFFTLKDERGFMNKDLLIMMEKKVHKSVIAKSNGEKGGAAKHKKEEAPPAIPPTAPPPAAPADDVKPQYNYLVNDIYKEYFDSEAFGNKWSEYKLYRKKEKLQGAYKEVGERRSLAALKRDCNDDVLVAIAAINNAMEKSWIGIFPDKDKSSPGMSSRKWTDKLK